MDSKRLKNVLANMENTGISQILISDPFSIFYLTGRRIDPGERFVGIYLNKNGTHKMFINKLFTVPEDLGIEKIWYSDREDGMELLGKYTDHSLPLGVDKIFPARFLIPLMEYKAASFYINASSCVDEARALKDGEEQEKMRAVSRMNDKAMEELQKRIRGGMTELELSSELDKIYKELGSEGYSFKTLVGFGANAAKGHHEPDRTKLQEGDCVLIDMGCKKDDYCADMTRTFFYQYAAPQHKKIYEIVKRANEEAEAVIKPGVRFCDIDKTARDIIEKEGYGDCFTHRLGHFIGLEVHEQGDVSAANTAVAKSGMIFSVEPGIYLEGETGVRIEDLVLVTENGCEILNHYSKKMQTIGS